MSDITIQPFKRETQNGADLVIIRVQHSITQWVQHVFNIADAETIYRDLGRLLGHDLTPDARPSPLLETTETTAFLTSLHGRGEAFFYRVEGGTPPRRVAYVYRGFDLDTASLPLDWTHAVGVLMSWALQVDAKLDSPDLEKL